MKKNIGPILKFLREERDLSMEEMAIQLKEYDVSPSKSMISRWENGKSEPSMEYARILSSFFDVSLDYLLGLSNKRSNKDNGVHNKFVQGSVDILLKHFLDSGLITDIDNMDKDTEDMILSLVKRELKKIKEDDK